MRQPPPPPNRAARRALARQAPKATRQQVRLVVQQVKAAVARQIALHEQHDALVTNDALFESARDLRRQAQQHLNAGDHKLAADLIGQAELLESAAQKVTPD